MMTGTEEAKRPSTHPDTPQNISQEVRIYKNTGDLGGILERMDTPTSFPSVPSIYDQLLRNLCNSRDFSTIVNAELIPGSASLTEKEAEMLKSGLFAFLADAGEHAGKLKTPLQEGALKSKLEKSSRPVELGNTLLLMAIKYSGLENGALKQLFDKLLVADEHNPHVLTATPQGEIIAQAIGGEFKAIRDQVFRNAERKL